MNKLEVGMYVRTKKGIIEKVIDKYEAPYGYKVVVNEDCRFKHYEHNYIKYILKASHNIIDLIEVGDYVNGSKVNIVESEYIYWESGNAIHHKYIETVVTKEQFSSMEYKVGDKNE